MCFFNEESQILKKQTLLTGKNFEKKKFLKQKIFFNCVLNIFEINAIVIMKIQNILLFELRLLSIAVYFILN